MNIKTFTNESLAKPLVLQETPLINFIIEQGYIAYANTHINTIFVDKKHGQTILNGLNITTIQLKLI